MPPRPTKAAAVAVATAGSAARVTRSRTRAVPTAPAVAVATTASSSFDPPPRKKRRTAMATSAKGKGPAAAAAKADAVDPPQAPPRPPSEPPTPVHLPTAISHLCDVDARFGPLFERIPCRPFLTAPPSAAASSAGGAAAGDIDPFRTLVTSIIGQQVSWMAARSITKRFVQLFCGPDADSERYDAPAESPFPTREQVAAAQVADLKSVGCSTRKAEYLIELAQHFVSGRLTDNLLLNGSDSEVAEALIAVRGIGRWTVDMFLIFTLRRPDVLPVGDLGVQKGLLRWVLAAHGALPPPPVPKTPKTPKTPTKKGGDHEPSDYGLQQLTPTPSLTPAGTLTETAAATSLGPTPSTATEIDVPTPSPYVLVTPTKLSSVSIQLASTPAPPPLTPSASTNPNTLPPSAPDSILATPSEWDNAAAHRAAPLPEGLSVSILKQRLAGKKAKGGVYLLPAEMEALTQHWRPYRSVGTYYTWSMAGEKS